jgi:CRP/FNR family transcriptional regulator, cyclic AMP receptor protein
MSSRVTFLGELNKLDDTLFEQLLKIGRRRSYPKRTVVFRQGDMCSEVMALLSGRISLIDHASFGKDTFVAVRFPGQLLGEGDITRIRAPGTLPRRRFTAGTLADSDVLAIDGDKFMRFLNDNLDAWECVARDMQARLDTAEFRIALASAPALMRLARVLGFLMDPDEAHEYGWSHVSGVTQSELAAWIGSSLRTVERHIARLKKMGIVETKITTRMGEATITIWNTDDLAEQAGLPPDTLPRRTPREPPDRSQRAHRHTA